MTPTKSTVESFLQYPFELWAPDSLIARAESQEVTFTTENHRGLAALFHSKNRDKLQSIFDESIKPLLEMQNTYRQRVVDKEIEASTELPSEDNRLTHEKVSKYLDELGHLGVWVLPAEGFIDPKTLPEEVPMPKCFGMLAMILQP